MAEQAPSNLDGVRLLADLTPAERDQVAKACRWRRYGAGEQIIDNQSDTRDVFFVVKGTVRVVNYSASGREVAFRLAHAVPPDGDRVVLKPIPHHSDIASRVSTTRETVARVFSDLAKSGIVKRERDAMVVLDVGLLEEMVENVRNE